MAQMWSHRLQKFARPSKVYSHLRWNCKRRYEGTPATCFIRIISL